MSSLRRFTVSVLFMWLFIFTVNTLETEEVDSNAFSSPETLHSDEEDDSKISDEEIQGLTGGTYAKSLYNEYERRRRLQSIHDNLASKLQKALVKKLQSPEYNQRINITNVEKYLQHDNDLEVPSGRRSFNKDADEESVTNDNPDVEDGRRGYIKKVTYVVEQPNIGHTQVLNIHDSNLQNLQSVNEALAGARSGYTVVTNNNAIKSYPYQTIGYINDPKITQITPLPNYYMYGQTYMDLTNPVKMYYNYYPGNRYIRFNKNFFDYSNHVGAQNHFNDFKQVTGYLTTLMNADKYANPNVILILKDANDLNFAEITTLDKSKLVQIDKSDLEYLKKYLILILNKYGMTPYVFRLMEYINLVEGRPRNEVNLVFKILSNQQAVYGLNRVEADELRAHLQHILKEYGMSPYILPFVRNIGGIQFETKGNDDLYDFDFDPSSHLSRDIMRRIYLHLSQSYNNNQIIIQILRNVNRIYETRHGVPILPKLNLNEYQNLYYLSRNDLYLLAKYLIQIKIQKGDNTYLTDLLTYIDKLQALDKGIYVTVIKGDHNTVKGLDLTGFHKILQDINQIRELKPEIIVILHQLINLETVDLNDMGKIINYLKLLKEYLLRNKIYEYEPLFIKILYELNNAGKEENLPPIEDDEKWISVKVTDLEIIYQYLLSNEKFRNNPYIISFVNEIVQIMQRGKLNANIDYKFRYSDLLKIYEIIQLYEENKENPIYLMILHYLDQDKEIVIPKHDNETITNDDLYLIMEYIGDNQINLNIIYKFLLYEIESGNSNEVLLELLRLINRTLLLPNGELKINVIILNQTQPYRQISSNDLQKLYLYLKQIIQDKVLSVDLLKFYKKQKQEDKLNKQLFYNVTKESLNRLRNFLLILNKERGENIYILEVLTEINHELRIPEDKKYVINRTDSNVNENDLILLIKYLSEINLIDKNADLINILKYLEDIKEKIEKENTKEWVYVNAQDLELIYQYLLGKEKFLHSPYLALFVNEILPLIQRGKQNPYENITYKFKQVDLLQLYNLILSDEKDKENPIYVMILKYLNLDKDETKKNNGTIPNVNLNILKEYFGDQINLELVYKFLTDEMNSGNQDTLLIELLQFIKRTLIIPNGQLVIKMINLDDTENLKVIQLKDLRTLYLYLQELIKQLSLSAKLLEYMEREMQKEKSIQEMFSKVNLETLIRLRNYLLILLREIGENQFVLEVLFEINNILGITKGYDKNEHPLNGTKYEIKEDDLKLFITYFNEINNSDANSSDDITIILNYLYHTRNRINKEKYTKDKLIYISKNDLRQIYQYLLSRVTLKNKPYIVIFMDEILPLIQQENMNPYENMADKLRHTDLQIIFNLIISQEKDKENPIYKKILKYLDLYKGKIDNKNETISDLDLHALYEYFGYDQINLNIVYEFLIHEVTSGNKNEVLIELLQYINNTLLLPNGEFTIKTIYLNGPKLTAQSRRDLQKLLTYLQKLMKNDIIRNKLLNYIKAYEEIFSNASKESLNRLRNFLLILIRDQGDNHYITEVLFEINIILGIPESKNNQMYILNGTDSKINKEDLKLLIKYFSMLNTSDSDKDISYILQFLHETEDKIKNEEENFNDNWIYINAGDLQQIYEYLLGKETFINSPYLLIFVNEILPFIQKAKQRPHKNLLYKFKYQDLQQLYKLVLSNEKDKDNPIYIMISEYLDVFKDDDDDIKPVINFNKFYEYFGDQKINVDVIYKFLSHKIESGSHNKVLIELLQLIKRTLLLPNGQLKVKFIYLSGTDPNLHPNDLQKLYAYLQKLIENDVLSIELFNYTKKYNQKEEQIHNILIDVTQESLIRLRNFLFIIIKELGENPFVLDILVQINKILGMPENSHNQPPIANGTKYVVNEKDLELLINYFTEINIYGTNSELIKILDYLNEVKNKIKHDEGDSKGQWISVNIRELELLYQYLLSKEKFLNSAYVDVIIKEIQPLIISGKKHPKEVVIYKLKAKDLLKIYEFLKSHEKNKENPILIRILHFLEQATNNITKPDNGTNVDLHVLNEYFGDKQIDLDIVYKFLLHEMKTDNLKEILLDLFEVLKRIQLSKGQLKVIYLNGTKPTDQINPDDLQKIYLYLQRIINDNTLSVDLLEYYTKQINQRKQILQLLTKNSNETLNGLRNYLLILIREGDANPVILQLLFVIDGILEIPENDHQPRHINTKNVDENDLEVLEKVLTIINGPDDVDIRKVIDKIVETKKTIKQQEENKKKSDLFQSYVLKIINNRNITHNVKLIFESLWGLGLPRLNQSGSESQFDVRLRESIANLSTSDFDVLIYYLEELINKFRPVYLVEELMPYIEKIKEDHKDDSIIKHMNNETLIVNVTRHNLDVFQKYLLELINQFGENNNILHIIYKINKIEERPDADYYWDETIKNNTNDIQVLKVGDVNKIIEYLLTLIKKVGPTASLMKMLRDFSKLPKEKIEATNRKVTAINSTHLLVTLEDDDVTRIKSYLVEIINDSGPNPYLVKILKTIHPKQQGDDYNLNKKQTNVYIFEKLNNNDLNVLTRYILQLTDKQGANSELIEILNFIYEINGDLDKDNTNEQYVIEISKEIQKLRDNNIIATIRSMNRQTLITIYNDMLDAIFNTLNINNDFTRIMVKLLDIYKKEDSPVKKYIILKWYEYLIRNKGVSYNALLNPDFINKLLEVDNGGSDQDIILTTENYTIVTPIDYSLDIDKILNELIDGTLRTKTPEDSEEENRKMDNPDTDEGKPDLQDRIQKIKDERETCLDAHKRSKDISKTLNNIKKMHRHDIHISEHDMERIIDIFVVFADQLKQEKHKRRIPTRLVIDEFENRLLSQNTNKCKQSDAVKQIISTVVVHLRDVISYLKSVPFSKEEIMIIVKSTLEEDIMPDIKAISVQECTAAADKDILEALLSNVYAKTYDKDENTEELTDDVHLNGKFKKLSTRDLLKKISKIGTLSATNRETKE